MKRPNRDERRDTLERVIRLALLLADLTRDLTEVADCVARWPEEELQEPEAGRVIPFRRRAA